MILFGNAMDAGDPVAELNLARRRKVPWHQVVRALRRLEGSSSGDEHGRPWVTVAAERSEYSANQLRQMDRTLLELEAATGRNPKLSLSEALRKPFSRLEMTARLLKADPEAGETLLSEENLAVPVSYQSLREYYYSTRDKMRGRGASMGAGQRAARTFVDTIYEKIRRIRIFSEYGFDKRIPQRREEKKIDYSEWKIAKWPGGYNFAHPDMVMVRKDGKAISGLQCKGLLQSPYKFDGIIPRTAFESTFFYQYFVVAPLGKPIRELAHVVSELGLLNVGILALNDAKLEVHLLPTGEPSPDRRTLLLTDSYMMQRVGAALR
jgi:hypothetical protein